MKKVKVIQLKFRGNLGAQGSKLRLQGYIHGAYKVTYRSRSYRSNPAASVQHKHTAVLTLVAMTSFQELYPGTRQPRGLPKQSDAVLAELGREQTIPRAAAAAHQPMHGGGKPFSCLNAD